MPGAEIPKHVPQNLVRNFLGSHQDAMARDPFTALRCVYKEEGQDIFFDPLGAMPTHPHLPGAWILTRNADIREILQNPELFSSKGITGFSKLLGQDWDLIPVELDPPAHSKFRAVMNPLFSPKRIRDLEYDIRACAAHLVRDLAQQTTCEFNESFGRPLPVTIFVRLMGLPMDEFDTFMRWEDMVLHSMDMAVCLQGAAEIHNYLKQLIAKRKAQPVDDLVSFAVKAEIDGQRLTDDEIMGICFLLFVGGLDTVAASLAFTFKYLAENPEARQRLINQPDLVAPAVEEILRTHSVVVTNRILTQDTTFRDIDMKKGDCVVCYTALGSMDPKEFENSQEIILDRSPNRHLAFSSGPHRCLGSHLARREMHIAIEEWLKEIPDFWIPEGAEIRAHGGIFGLDSLPLCWE